MPATEEKLRKLASNPFTVLGEARVTDSGIALTILGDFPPEPKLGLAPGTFPSSIEATLAMMHPDDQPSFQQAVEHSRTTGAPFDMNYRLADGRGGWLWIQTRAICIEKRDGKHVHWLSDTRDITDLKETEKALLTSLEELGQLKMQIQEEKIFLREEMERESLYMDIIGRSAAMNRVLDQVELVAGTAATVLISGETGTGKELIARAIHQRSDRRKRLFVAMNCAALPTTLVESELFGHEKGAFTGAIARRMGRFEQADGGTLFLDEVGELPLEAQAKMLRVLQSGEFERVGGERPLKVNVRIIAASNRDLEQAVRDGRFRGDLYHRLAIFPIHLPPLRERYEDIPLLAAYLIARKAHQFGRKIENIPTTVLDRLAAYDWPGNVRELENVLERAIILSPGTTLRLEAILMGSIAPVKAREHHTMLVASADAGANDTLRERERAHILRVCQATGWKIRGKDGAATILDIDPGTLYARMKKLGIRRPTPH